MDPTRFTRPGRGVRAGVAAVRGRRRAASERGMATAELAVALPVLALVVGILLWSIQLAGVHLACGAAAREAARALARGESAESLAERSRALPQGAPAGPRITLATAHPAKFPETVRQAVGAQPALPAFCRDLFDRPEAIDCIGNDLGVLQAFIRERSRAWR